MSVPRWRAPYDFSAARPTFVDAWPAAWCSLAPETAIVRLNRTEANALGAQITGFRNWFTPTSPAPLLEVAQRLDSAIARQGRSSFVRLNSRSPKDSLLARRKGMCVRNGAEALAMFIGGSERCAADLRMALDHPCDVSIVVRRWIEIPPWSEFRCYMISRRWVGAHQVQHPEGAGFPALPPGVGEIVDALGDAMQQISSDSPVENGAFELVVLPGSAGQGPPARLLDANPLLDVTDLGLFRDQDDLDCTIRFRCTTDGSLTCRPLVC